jgi:hypothetical protein
MCEIDFVDEVIRILFNVSVLQISPFFSVLKSEFLLLGTFLI